MDPYLEARWGDVHTALCLEIRTALQPDLPSGLRARAQEEVFVNYEEEEEERYQRYQPDAYVYQTGGFTGATAVAAEIATVKPILVKPLPIERKNRWVTIVDTKSHNRIVTAIEILSPSNKTPGRRNKSYYQKISDYIAGGVNVVEIDLLRSPRYQLRIELDELPAHQRADYLLNIQRASRNDGVWEVYPVSLRDPLPVIPIPLRATDRDVQLALQPIIDRIYVEGGHDDIDYTQPPSPAFDEGDVKWFTVLLAKRMEETIR